MIIRAYQPRDAAPLAVLYRQSVQQLGQRHYTPRQIATWASLGPSAERLQAQSQDGRLRLVAVDDTQQPLGFIDLEPDGHIHYLYCSPMATGQGVASALYDELQSLARNRGIQHLHAEASEVARGFFLKQGFTVVARREFIINGVSIHNYAVEKTLAPQS